MNKKTFWINLISGEFAQMVKETAPGNQLSSSQALYNLIRPLTDAHNDVEKTYGIFMNRQNKIITLEVLSTGSITGSAVYPREIVKDCLKYKASALTLAHNHPSGAIIPSNEDNALTKSILFAVRLVGTTLLEHIIVGNTTYYSYADNNKLAPWSKEFDSLFHIKGMK